MSVLYDSIHWRSRRSSQLAEFDTIWLGHPLSEFSIIIMFSDNFRRGEGGKGKTGSKAVSKIADIGWKAFQAVNKVIPEGQSIQPSWAAEPLLKSHERTAPPLGFPRETDSLCPACVKSVRNGVISGDI